MCGAHKAYETVLQSLRVESRELARHRNNLSVLSKFTRAGRRILEQLIESTDQTVMMVMRSSIGARVDYSLRPEDDLVMAVAALAILTRFSDMANRLCVYEREGRATCINGTGVDLLTELQSASAHDALLRQRIAMEARSMAESGLSPSTIGAIVDRHLSLFKAIIPKEATTTNCTDRYA